MKNETLIVCIIDKSGSMARLTNETITGFNQFIEEQKQLPDKAKIFTVLFDSGIFNHYSDVSLGYKTIHNMVDIHDAELLSNDNYKAGGGTALLDAIGKTVDSIGITLNNMPEEERPNKVLVLIQTDGEENASTKYTFANIKEKVELQRNVYKWEFIFLGANIDSFDVGSSLGSSNNFNFSASSIGVSNAYNAMSKNVSNYRASGVTLSAAETTTILNENIKEDLNKP